MTPRSRPRDAGLTLIELVVAMAVFALVAIMGVQALTGSLRSRDRLVALDAESAELGLALSLLRADLGAMVPMLFYPPDGPPRGALDLGPRGREIGLSLAGQPVLPPMGGPGLHRAIWRHDPVPRTLSRQIWPVLSPAEPGGAAPEVVVLNGVTGLTLRSHWQTVGWVPGARADGIGVVPDAPGPADSDGATATVPSRYSSTLPQAVELTLDTLRHGRIVVMESLK